MIVLLVFILGLFLGSFLNVVADRYVRKESFIKGRSYCENCKKELGVFDLIPVLSYLSLGGKCRYCKKKISIYYPISEILTGAVLATSAYLFLGNPVFLVYSLFILSVFLIIFFADLKYGIIPTNVLVTGILISLFYLLTFEKSLFINHLLSAVGAFGFFLLVTSVFYALTKKESMGGGDLKLSFLIGLFLGFPHVITALYIAFLTGALISIILVLWKKKRFKKDTIPFGPFMVFGAVLTLFWGEQILQLALRLLGL